MWITKLVHERKEHGLHIVTSPMFAEHVSGVGCAWQMKEVNAIRGKHSEKWFIGCLPICAWDCDVAVGVLAMRVLLVVWTLVSSGLVDGSWGFNCRVHDA